MGNKTSTNVNQPFIPNDVINTLNETTIDQKYIDNAITKNQKDISRPFITILSTKQSNDNLCKLQEENSDVAVIYGTSHAEITLNLKNAIKEKFDAKKYNGIILILLCVISGNQDPSTFSPKFYYDQKQSKRHTNDLRKDICPRLPDSIVMNVDFNQCVSFVAENNKCVSTNARFRSAYNITQKEHKPQTNQIQLSRMVLKQRFTVSSTDSVERIKHIAKQMKDQTFDIDAVDIQLILNDFLDICSSDDAKLLQSLYIELGAGCGNQCRILYRDAEIHISAERQILSKIHCFFAHNYDMGKLTPDEQKVVAEASNTEINADTDEPVEFAYFKNPTKIKRREILENKRIDFNKLKITQNRVQKYKQIINVDSNHDQNKMFRFGFKFHYETETKCAEDEREIKPRFTNLGEELVDNNIQCLGINQYKSEYKKAQIHCESNFNRRSAGIMTIQHILSVMIYCNFTQLQHEFTKTYWNEKNHISFYYLGLWLKRSVHEFGKILDSQNRFYHGISEKLLFPAFINNVQINFPLSTSSSLDVAMNFTNFSGLVVEFCRANIASGEVKQFACWWCSDFAHENEHLFIQNESPLQIDNILDTAIGFEFRRILIVLRIIDCILNGIPSIDSERRSLTRRIIQHQLSHSSDEYKPLKGLNNNYGGSILDTYFKNKKQLRVNCKSKESYLFLHEKLLIPKPTIWINIPLIMMLYPNCQHINVENVCISSEMIEDILMHLKHWNVLKIEIDYMNKEFDILKYKQKFYDCYNFLLTKEDFDNYGFTLCLEKMNNIENSEQSSDSIKSSNSTNNSESSGTEYGLRNGPIAIRKWFENDVCLSQEYMEKYYDLFIEHQYDTVGTLLRISENDLTSIGINKRAHIEEILCKIGKLKSVV